jgi:FAD/FMN-containing dehydrogenase
MILLSFTKICHLVCVAFSGCIEAGHMIDSRQNKELGMERNEESKNEMKKIKEEIQT